MGGWSGAAWDPGYFLLAYLSPDYIYSTSWDTENTMMTFTMVGVGPNGEDITETMGLLAWYDCLNGAAGAKYDWSANALPQSKRLQLIAALEKEVLTLLEEGKKEEAQKLMNRYTADFEAATAQTWKEMEHSFWERFWINF